MPTPTDPKLNLIEKTWGILYHDGINEFCWYEKNNSLRAVCQGSELIVNKVEDITLPYDGGKWNGIPINKKAVNVSYDEANTGPIYRTINNKLKRILFNGNGTPKSLTEVKGSMSDEEAGNRSDFGTEFNLDNLSSV